jgi:hypothetical protein
VVDEVARRPRYGTAYAAAMQIDDGTVRAILSKPLSEVTVAEVVCLVLAVDDDPDTEDRVAALAVELVPGATSSAP